MLIRIAVADDHPVVIKGIQSMLANYPHICMTGTYTSHEELLQGLSQELPDILLLDIQFPGSAGEELTSVILKKYPTLSIIALTNFNSVLYVNSMLRQGARGYVLKTTEEDILIKAITTVYEKEEIYLEPSLKEELKEFENNKRRVTSPKASLTPREKEILQLITDGYTGQEIAKKVFISFSTVEHYRNNILLKMDVKNTAALIKKALTLGLVK